MVCPYGVIQNIPGRVGLMKCDLCVDRLEREEIPACAASCPTEAIVFRQIEDIAVEKQEIVAKEFSSPGRQYEIDEEACTGCMLCAKKCPYDAVIGENKKPHRIDGDKCVNCGVCFAVCRFDAVKKFSDVDMIFCTDCGQPVGAGTHMDQIAGKITVKQETLSLCPACRRKKISVVQTAG
jgi:ferredoxin